MAKPTEPTRIVRIAEDLFRQCKITNAEAFAIVYAVETADHDKIKEKGGTFTLDGLLSLFPFEAVPDDPDLIGLVPFGKQH